VTAAQQHGLGGPDGGAAPGAGQLARVQHGESAQLAVQVEVHVSPSSPLRSTVRGV